MELSFDEGLAKERDLFIACQQNSQSKALQHVFFAERQAANIPNLPKGTKTREIKSVGIIGAGTMGGGIAMNFANVGLPGPCSRSSRLPRQGLGIVRRNYRTPPRRASSPPAVRARRPHQGHSIQRLQSGRPGIEAVFETMASKGSLHEARRGRKRARSSRRTPLPLHRRDRRHHKRPATWSPALLSPANVMRARDRARRETTPTVPLARARQEITRSRRGRQPQWLHGNPHLSGYGSTAGAAARGRQARADRRRAARVRHADGPAADGRPGRPDIATSRARTATLAYDGRATKIADLPSRRGASVRRPAPLLRLRARRRPRALPVVRRSSRGRQE